MDDGDDAPESAPRDPLRDSEVRFRLLVEAVTDYAIYLLDPDGYVTTWNSGAEKIKGYTAAEIIGRHYSTFFRKEDVDAGKPLEELRIARTQGRYEEEGWRVRKDGTPFWSSVVLTAIRDADGHLTGFAKVTRDLTARRAAEEASRELIREQAARAAAESAEERLRVEHRRYRELSLQLQAILEGIPDGVTVQDRDGRLLFANSAAARACGADTVEELLRTPPVAITDRFEVDDEFGHPIPVTDLPGRRVLAGERNASALIRVRARDGHEVTWKRVRASGVGGTPGSPDLAVNVWHDVTAERVREEHQRQLAHAADLAARRAEHANRSKDEFLATVSHELRTPLNAIVGWASLLAKRNVDPFVAKGVDVISRNARAQGKLIEDVLDLSRVASGKMRLELRSVDLVQIARDSVEVVRPSAEAKRVSLHLDAPEDFPKVVADPERLQQVLWNLLSNAVKFSVAGGRIDIRITQNGSACVVTVQDDGLGIAPDFLPQVFEHFKQADGSTTRRFGGLGLGLGIVRHIVELHGGTVQAESPGRGMGATFTFSLPIRAVAPSTPKLEPPNGAPVEPVPRRVGVSLAGVRVLVVDDEQDARELLEAVFVEAGALVATAASAAEGFAALRDFLPDVLVSDIGMPGEDGYTFVGRVKAWCAEAGRRLPAVALTAYARAEDAAMALRAGFDAHLGKPVNPDALVSLVAGLVRKSTRPRPRLS
ncbi:MAG TPA: ATP-binding protein [Polyangiaceae bacterium]|nr:ATP-binding protein [Polyangiaceae bacterium]